MWKAKGKSFYIVKLSLLIALPIILFCLPASYFDHGQSICPSKRFLNLECLGCGLTRGIQHLIHLEFEMSWAYNKLSIPIVIIALYFWIKHVTLAFKAIKKAVI